MNYLYHWVPKNMEGDVLYPLNVLRDQYPTIYEEHKLKYKDREDTMKLCIPKINCLWNDVLHLSAIHPKIIKEAIATAGGRNDYKMACYQIDPHMLNPENTIVYLFTTPYVDTTKIDDFVEFKPDEIGQYSSLPETTKKYYKERYDNKKLPLTFNQVPHIFYKGCINIKDCPIIEV